MDQMEAIQNAITLLLDKAQNATVSELASAVEKASGALRVSTDLEKSRAEIQKLALEESRLRYQIDSAPKRERSERLKEYVSLLAPIVSVIALAATLIVQGWQFSRTEKDKREAAEDAQWADTVKTLSQNSKLSPSAMTLNPFLKSPKYRDLARSTAIGLLATTSDPVLFTDLFGAAFVPVDWNNLDPVLKLDRQLSLKAFPLWEKTYDAKTNTNDVAKLSAPEDRERYEYLDIALPQICSQVGAVLRTPRRNDVSPDLSGGLFYDCKWDGVDLSGANLESTDLRSLDLKGANLANISRFDGAYFFAVAWWEAKSISPELLDYLETRSDSQYKETATYGPNSEHVTPQRYKAALDRLKR